MSEYMRDRYRMDDDGNFETPKEAERALKNDDLEELSNGNLYDANTSTVYWPDGTKKE